MITAHHPDTTRQLLILRDEYQHLVHVHRRQEHTKGRRGSVIQAARRLTPEQKRELQSYLAKQKARTVEECLNNDRDLQKLHVLIMNIATDYALSPPDIADWYRGKAYGVIVAWHRLAVDKIDYKYWEEVRRISDEYFALVQNK